MTGEETGQEVRDVGEQVATQREVGLNLRGRADDRPPTRLLSKPERPRTPPSYACPLLPFLALANAT